MECITVLEIKAGMERKEPEAQRNFRVSFFYSISHEKSRHD